jgi:hypothetical protein
VFGATILSPYRGIIHEGLAPNVLDVRGEVLDAPNQFF